MDGPSRLKVYILSFQAAMPFLDGLVIWRFLVAFPSPEIGVDGLDDIFMFTNVKNLPEVRVISLRKEDCLKVFPNRKVTPDQADILFSGQTNADELIGLLTSA